MKKVLGIYEDSAQQLMLENLTRTNPMFGAIFLLGVSTGLRIGDLLNLRADICQNFTITENKTGKERSISLNDNVWRILQDYIAKKGLKSSDRLFPTTRQTVHKHIRRLGSFLGHLRLGSHSMRVTYAWNVYRASTCLKTVKKAMNHKYISTTILYLVGGLEWLIGCHMGEFGGIEPCFSQIEDSKQKNTDLQKGG